MPYSLPKIDVLSWPVCLSYFKKYDKLKSECASYKALFMVTGNPIYNNAIILNKRTMIQIRNKIVQGNLRLAYSVVFNNNNLDCDNFSEASLALLKAVETFDYRVGAVFSTYAVRVINSYLINIKRKNHLIYNKHQCQNIGIICGAKKSLELQGIFNPSVIDIVNTLNARNTVRRWDNKLVSSIIRMSNTKLVQYDDYFDCQCFDKEYNDDINIVLNALNCLSARERNIVKLKFGLDCDVLNLSQIGKLYKITRERVRQILFKAIEKIRNNCSVATAL